MSALEDFLTEHRLKPWPTGWDDDIDGAPARVLYDTYRAAMEAQDRPVKSPNDFGAAVREAGYRSDRTRDGVFYPGLTVESRHERAEASVLADLRALMATAVRYRVETEHKARRHADGSWCEHRPPQSALNATRAEGEAEYQRAMASGEVGALVETRFGPWLRHRRGDADPTTLIWFADLLHKRVDLQREEANLRAVIGAGGQYEARGPGISVLAAMSGQVATEEEHAHWAAKRRLEAVLRERDDVERKIAVEAMRSANPLPPVPDQDVDPDQGAEGW